MLMEPNKSEALSVVIEIIAKREGVSAQEVKAAMQEAIQEGFNNLDPAVREQWAQIPIEGDVPTPEEVIFWASCKCNSTKRK